MFDNADLNMDAYGVECKMNNNYTHVARWSVSNTLLVNSFHHYLCTYGMSPNKGQDRHDQTVQNQAATLQCSQRNGQHSLYSASNEQDHMPSPCQATLWLV
jgi:hypothetical protein